MPHWRPSLKGECLHRRRNTINISPFYRQETVVQQARSLRSELPLFGPISFKVPKSWEEFWKQSSMKRCSHKPWSATSLLGGRVSRLHPRGSEDPSSLRPTSPPSPPRCWLTSLAHSWRPLVPGSPGAALSGPFLLQFTSTGCRLTVERTRCSNAPAWLNKVSVPALRDGGWGGRVPHQ